MASPVREKELDVMNEKAPAGPARAPASVDGVTLSQSQSNDFREQETRLVDDLELLRAEQLVTNMDTEGRSSMARDRHHQIPEDAFNSVVPTGQTDGQKADMKPTVLNKIWNAVRKYPRIIRYFVYMLPIGIILLTPILLDLYALPESSAPVGGDGGVKLMWFGTWLEIVWVSLWATRTICAIMPHLFNSVAKIVGSTTPRKWMEIGLQLELPTSLFVWMLSVLVSYHPIMTMNRDEGGNWNGTIPPPMPWIDIVQRVIIALFVLAALNFVEKILIQWIASSFHLRTYAYRIDQNKREIDYLVKLFEYARRNAQGGQLPWDPSPADTGSGARTPYKAFQNNARQALKNVGNAAQRMAGDFTGRKVLKDNHPQKIVQELLRTTSQSHTLARMIYRAFAQNEGSNVVQDDFLHAFATAEEAEACFAVFDKDLNGDISMEELEISCNEIHLERKAIAASLKDLDSVIRKLDQVFLVITFIIAIIVFISIISGSAAAALGSAGTTLLGLAWMLQATAQEFLQSIIFVFVKHPFDVGDRVTVYGNTGVMMRGDDYYVQEISLLYTEFKKMEGHVVQAPNSLLNNLFILNQRRSNGLADPIELKFRYGTAESLIEELKARMLDFVLDNKRDYAPRIISEVRTIEECWAVTMNLIFFHKSNYQNELLRLQRHNKFATELMKQMYALGIEGPRRMQPGGNKDYPMYWSSIQPPAYDGNAVPPTPGPGGDPTVPGSATRRRRAESRGTIRDMPDFGDVYDSRRVPPVQRLRSIREPENLRLVTSPGGTTPMDRTGSRDSHATTASAMRGPSRVLGRQRTLQRDGAQIV